MSAKQVSQLGHYAPPSENQHELSYIAQYNAGQTNNGVDFGYVSSLTIF